MQTAAIIDATTAFFDEVEARDDAPSSVPQFRFSTLATPASVGSDGIESADLLGEHGPVSHLTGYRISWYPMDRFLGTVDFMGTWNGNRDLVCGYVTWDLSDPSTPVLESVTANYVDLARLDTATASEQHEALLEANCAYGEVEPNFTVFNAS